MSKQHEEQPVLDKIHPPVKKEGPVECLGIEFENDETRREYFLSILREKLRDPEFRKIEGFPIGEDEDILALSDPPYYTACPNPFIEDLVKYYGERYDPNETYRREPFASDVSEGKNDPIYNAHSYHTKVPHKAIVRYMLHYTEPGNIVFDGFCGTGMAGVAAQFCGDRKTVESLGYRVLPDGTILDKDDKPFSGLGARRAILNDLSPAATFIAHNYNTPVDVEAFQREATRILKEVEEECGWMYETAHTDSKTRGRINYTVWSDVFVCPECVKEVVFWEAAVDKEEGKVNSDFPCSHCGIMLNKRNIDRAWETKFDKAINQTVRQVKQAPVLINYSVGGKRFEKDPDELDLALIEKIENSNTSYWFPIDRMPEGDESRRNDRIGITHVHHFYTKRNLLVLSFLRRFLRTSKMERQLLCLVGDLLPRASKMHKIAVSRLNTNLSKTAGVLAGTLYVPSNQIEYSVASMIGFRIKAVASYQAKRDRSTRQIVFTCSAETSRMKSCSIDYIFTDPPFGGNLMYSELNFLWEAWLKVFTDNGTEAIENKMQGKGLIEYQLLMTGCFKEYYRVLKPGHWMTVEFHNSKNSVWNAIQEALQRAGFVIADIRTLDKKQGSFKQVTSSNAVKQDLIISTYKPNSGLEERFKLEAGSEAGVWDFIHTHLKQLPVFVDKNGQAEVIAERQSFLLFDRMVAFHIQRGVTVPLSASEFYDGLSQRFPERDGMYFLPEQIAEYDRKRMTVNELMQLELFVSDEETAIQWLRQQLTKKPQTFQDIHPHFLREIGGWKRHEKPLELMEMLAENFLRHDGNGDVPSQIHGYLSTNFKDLRNLPKDDPTLRAKARDRWYVPDPNKAGDLEKLREKSLLREFEEYRESKQKRLKIFRLEAVRTGFKKAWQERDYQIIIEVARKIPDNILQEDQKLLMWYDQALTRTEED